MTSSFNLPPGVTQRDIEGPAQSTAECANCGREFILLLGDTGKELCPRCLAFGCPQCGQQVNHDTGYCFKCKEVTL